MRPGRTHAGGGHNDGRPLQRVEGHRLLHRAHNVERREPQQRLAAGDDLLRLGVETLTVAAKDLVHGSRHRAVEKDGHLGNLFGLEQPVEVVDQFLGPLDGENRHNHLAAARHGLGNYLLQLRFGRAGKRGQVQFAGTALRVLRTIGPVPISPPSCVRSP